MLKKTQSKKKKKKNFSWNISYTVRESANFSNTLLSYAEKAFASAESSCLLLTIRCTGTSNLDCGHLQVARSTQIIRVHQCTLIYNRRAVRCICLLFFFWCLFELLSCLTNKKH